MSHIAQEKIVRCCERIIKTGGRPAWMIDNHDTCQTSVVRSGGKKYPGIAARPAICYIRVRFNDGTGDSKPGSNPPPRTNPNGAPG
jgi:hypothetical protein